MSGDRDMISWMRDLEFDIIIRPPPVLRTCMCGNIAVNNLFCERCQKIEPVFDNQLMTLDDANEQIVKIQNRYSAPRDPIPPRIIFDPGFSKLKALLKGVTLGVGLLIVIIVLRSIP
jgi:hypothetical protein